MVNMAVGIVLENVSHRHYRPQHSKLLYYYRSLLCEIVGRERKVELVPLTISMNLKAVSRDTKTTL